MPLMRALGRHRRAAAIALAAGLGLCGPAHAVLVTCLASTLPVVFGNYSASSPSPNDTTGTVTVSCVSVLGTTVNYTIALSSGGGSYSNRVMSAGVYQLNYQLYTDLAHTTVWGDGISAGTSTVSGTLVAPALSVVTSSSQTVYGRIPAAQSWAAPALYIDTITVTVTY